MSLGRRRFLSVTALLAVLGIAWAAGASRTQVTDALDSQRRTINDHEARLRMAEESPLSIAVASQRRRIDDHENRLRVVEESTISMAVDVHWIRNQMERNYS